MNKVRKKRFVLVVAAVMTGSAFAAENKSSTVTPNLDRGTRVLEGAGNIDFMADEIRIQATSDDIFVDNDEEGEVQDDEFRLLLSVRSYFD